MRLKDAQQRCIMSKVVILIPSRYTAKRLPGKPLKKVKGIPLIEHVYRKAIESKIGKVFVVTGDIKIFKTVKSFTKNCIITKYKHRTGTDRIYEGVKKLKLKENDYIVNLQGDEPLISVNDINRLVKKVVKKKISIGTLACKFKKNKKYYDRHIVKVQTLKKLDKKNILEAQNFFRLAKKKIKYLYHHIGIYIYKVKILKLFISLKQTSREKKFRLEQLRAIDNNIPIHVVLAKTEPLGIDTRKDLKKFKKILERNNF